MKLFITDIIHNIKSTRGHATPLPIMDVALNDIRALQCADINDRGPCAPTKHLDDVAKVSERLWDNGTKERSHEENDEILRGE